MNWHNLCDFFMHEEYMSRPLLKNSFAGRNVSACIWPQQFRRGFNLCFTLWLQRKWRATYAARHVNFKPANYQS